MARRRRVSFTVRTRRITAELGPEYDELVQLLELHAAIIDDTDNRPMDRQRSADAWDELTQRLAGRVADEVRKGSSTWGGSGLQAV